MTKFKTLMMLVSVTLCQFTFANDGPFRVNHPDEPNIELPNIEMSDVNAQTDNGLSSKVRVSFPEESIVEVPSEPHDTFLMLANRVVYIHKSSTRQPIKMISETLQIDRESARKLYKISKQAINKSQALMRKDKQLMCKKFRNNRNFANRAHTLSLARADQRSQLQRIEAIYMAAYNRYLAELSEDARDVIDEHLEGMSFKKYLINDNSLDESNYDEMQYFSDICSNVADK